MKRREAKDDFMVKADEDLTRKPKGAIDKSIHDLFWKYYVPSLNENLAELDITKSGSPIVSALCWLKETDGDLSKKELQELDRFVKAWRKQGGEYGSLLEKVLKNLLSEYLGLVEKWDADTIGLPTSPVIMLKKDVDVIWEELQQVAPERAKPYAKEVTKIEKLISKKTKEFEKIQSKKPVIDSCPLCGGKIVKDWDDSTKMHKGRLKQGEKPIIRHSHTGVLYKCKDCGKIIKRERIMSLYY